MSLILSGTDGLSDVDGSAATPAIRGTDANTGIFFPAADTIAFAEGGAEVARFNSSGNFLVGTTSSLSVADKMTVVGGNIAVQRTSGITSFIGDNTGNGYVGTATSHAFAFLTNSVEAARIDTSGNMTVGTISPSASYGRLTVAGTGISITPDTAAKFQIGRYSAGAPYSYIKMGSTSSGFKFTDPTDSFDLMALNSTGALSLYGASVSANGVGITFPATQSASSNANTLDDYEEGDWTPTQGAGLTVVGAFSSSGRYTKTGRQVFIEGVVTGGTSVAIPSVNAITISSLPFSQGFSRSPGLAGNEAISASAAFQVIGTNLYFMETMAATTNIRFSATYSV